MTQDERREKERKHVLSAIEWLDRAVYALDKADYSAAHHAIIIARMRIDEAEVMQNVRND